MKVLASMWRDLTAEKRANYNKIAEVDKNRYFKEMNSYTGPTHIPNKRQKKPPVGSCIFNFILLYFILIYLYRVHRSEQCRLFYLSVNK